jgi:omega-hydroxy-beta-dihydromenaquinone-9 sulfotransferase
MISVNPIFLLGPGRGGTTLVYKLLSLHPECAFISNFDVHGVRASISKRAIRVVRSSEALRNWAWFADEGQAYTPHRNLLRRLVPTPVEGESVYQSCGLPIGQCLGSVEDTVREKLRTRFARIQAYHAASAIVLKRTANNRRIPCLDSAFPEAKYVILWRDGRAVTASLLNVHWWMDHRVWWADARTPREMQLDRAGMVALAARNWVEEVHAIEQGVERIESKRVMHVRYEEMLSRPAETLQSILQFCGLRCDPSYSSQISKLKIRPDSGKWRRSFTADEMGTVEAITAHCMTRIGYPDDPIVRSLSGGLQSTS